MATKNRTKRVFLVDDHPVVRDGFRMHLEDTDGVTVTGEAGSGEEALEELEEREADLVIADISMEGMDGIELTRRLTEGSAGRKGLTERKSERKGPLVLIVSMHASTHYLESALEAGAQGYVLKESAPEVLGEAVGAVLNGGTYLCPMTRGKLDL